MHLTVFASLQFNLSLYAAGVYATGVCAAGTCASSVYVTNDIQGCQGMTSLTPGKT